MRISTRGFIAGLTTVGAVHAAPAISQSKLGRTLFPVVSRVDGSNGVALTFDDGPDVQIQQFLDMLDSAGATATFFLVGEQIVRNPEAPAAIVAAGHEVAVHGFTHRGHLRRSPWDLAGDLRRARAIIEDSTQITPRLYRPPYGVFTLGSWTETKRQGWTPVLWSRWGKDWDETATPQGIADRIGHPRAGDILLLHDSDRYSAPRSWSNTLDALPIILERIAEAGLRTQTVGEMLEQTGRLAPRP